MTSTLQKYRTVVTKGLVELEHYRQQVLEEKELLKESRLSLSHCLEAQKVLQGVAQAVQQEAHKQIAQVVTKCLTAVFDEPYKFRIEFERKRGKTEARLIFDRDGAEIDPLTGSGGGVVDIAAFALRIACVLLSQRQGRRLIVMDEAFRFLSVNYRAKARAMLKMLAQELDIQFVAVTHSPDLVTGKIVHVGMRD